MLTCTPCVLLLTSRGLILVSFQIVKHVLFYSLTTFRCWIQEGPRDTWGRLA
jgi:hypothetical protein